MELNNTLTNDPCAFCGGRCDPIGFDYFAEGTRQFVSDQCGEEYALDLAKIREAAIQWVERNQQR